MTESADTPPVDTPPADHSTADNPPVDADADALRSLMRHQASTVTVVTAPGPPAVGFTATSFTSVSLRPPVVSFCLNLGSSSWPAVSRAGHVGVHLLAHGQHDLARTFATSGIDRFAAAGRWRAGARGVPILEGVLAWLLCRVVDRVTVGDHAIVLAEPELLWHADVGSPLLYHRGRYAGLAEHVDAAAARPDRGGVGRGRANRRAFTIPASAAP